MNVTGIDPQDGGTDAVAAGSDRTDAALLARVRDGNAAAFWKLTSVWMPMAMLVSRMSTKPKTRYRRLMYAHFPRLTPSETRQAFRLG